MAKTSGWIANVGGHFIDEKTGENIRFEKGEPYLGPNPEGCAALGLVTPAFDAGSNEPGDEPEGDEA